MSAPPFQFKPTPPKQEWEIVVALDLKTKRMRVKSNGLPNVHIACRMLEDALKMVRDKASGVGATGLVAADGAELVKQGLDS